MKYFTWNILTILVLLICDTKSDTKCEMQADYIEENYQKGALWARQFRDSWGRFPSGIFSGNHYDFGNFHQCLNFQHHSEVASFIQGQYCLLTFPYDLRSGDAEISPKTGLRPYSPKINIGIGACLPSSCEDSELIKIANKTLNELVNISLSVDYRPDFFCSVKRNGLEFNALQISAIAIASILLLMIILSTSYEVSCNILHKPKHPLLSSFSLYSNSKIIMTMKPSSSNEMIFLHGIRSLAIIWIVQVHTYTNFWQLPVMNANYYFEWIRNVSTMFILSGALGVDTFFLMSSMLLTMSVFRELDKTKSLNVPLLLLKRYIRITVPFAAAILFVLTFLYYISNGPLWHLSIENATLRNCQNYWWSTLLYVANYVNPGELCFGHSWYLIVDMQLYFLSPLILYPLWRFKSYSKVMIPLIFLISSSSVIYMYLIFYIKEFRVSLLFPQSMERDKLTYYATQARIDSWMMGIFTGYVLHLLQGKKVKLTKIILFCGWSLSALAILGTTLGQYPLMQEDFDTNSYHADAAFSAFNRIAWCLAVSWIIIACQFNYGGFIKKFLSLSIWLPISKLSYCIYLVHLPIQLIFLASLQHPQYFSDATASHKFLGDFGLAVAVAFLWALVFEYPVLRLIKFFFEKRNSDRVNRVENTRM